MGGKFYHPTNHPLRENHSLAALANNQAAGTARSNIITNPATNDKKAPNIPLKEFLVMGTASFPLSQYHNFILYKEDAGGVGYLRRLIEEFVEVGLGVPQDIPQLIFKLGDKTWQREIISRQKYDGSDNIPLCSSEYLSNQATPLRCYLTQ